jgi:outer membrane protein assembly factor BamB
LTSFKTTIQFVSGAIIVGSNGNLTTGINDAADGLYMIDGKTGQIVRRIHWSESADLDVNGVAIAPRTVFFGNHQGSVYAYSLYGDSTRLWSRQLSGAIKGACAVEDFNSDGTYDVVAATDSGEITAMDGKTGAMMWSAKVTYRPNFTYPKEKSFVASPTLVDLNQDGTRDVLIGSRNGTLYAYDGRTGTILWEYRTRTPSGIHASALVWGESIVVAESYSTLTWLDFQGKIQRVVSLASEPDVQGIFASPVAFSDGSVVIGSSWGSGDSGIWMIPSTDTKPRFHNAGRISATAAIGDGLGLGKEQAWVVTERGQLWVILPNGDVAATYTLDSGSETTPLIADVDGDGRLELITTGADRMMRCYQLPGTGPVKWGTFRGNFYNTGVDDDVLEPYPYVRSGLRRLRRQRTSSPNEYVRKEQVYQTLGYDSESTLISPDGIGMARLGTTWGRLKRALGGNTEYLEGRFGLGYRGISVMQDNEEQFIVLFPEWKTRPADTDPISYLITYNHKYRTKEGVGPGTPISVAVGIFGTPTLVLDTKTKQESAIFKSAPWDKVRFGLIPVTGEYTNKGSIKRAKAYPDGSFIHYVEVRR